MNAHRPSKSETKGSDIRTNRNKKNAKLVAWHFYFVTLGKL
jgi:hypothetical protein